MEEIWKDIKGYEGLYQVSNLGRVKRLPYVIELITSKGNFIKKSYKESILKCSLARNGYKRVTLRKNSVAQYKHVHRIVAESFIPNTNNYPCINHKDENKTNNNVSNLEWCSYSYNNTYGDLKAKRARTYSINHSRKIEMRSMLGRVVKKFNSVKEAASFLGGTSTSIDRALNGTRKTAYGYKWNLI